MSKRNNIELVQRSFVDYLENLTGGPALVTKTFNGVKSVTVCYQNEDRWPPGTCINLKSGHISAPTYTKNAKLFITLSLAQKEEARQAAKLLGCRIDFMERLMRLNVLRQIRRATYRYMKLMNSISG